MAGGTSYHYYVYYNSGTSHLDFIPINYTCTSGHNAVKEKYKQGTWVLICDGGFDFADGNTQGITLSVCQAEQECYSMWCHTGGQVRKALIDGYTDGGPLPCVPFSLKWKGEKRADIPPENCPRVELVGAKEPNNYFIIRPVPAATGRSPTYSWTWRAILTTILTRVLPFVFFPSLNAVLRYFGMYSHHSEQYYALYFVSGAVTVLLEYLVCSLYKGARDKMWGLILLYFCAMVMTQFFILQYLSPLLSKLGMYEFRLPHAVFALCLLGELVRWYDKDFEATDTYKLIKAISEMYLKWRLVFS